MLQVFVLFLFQISAHNFSNGISSIGSSHGMKHIIFIISINIYPDEFPFLLLLEIISLIFLEYTKRWKKKINKFLMYFFSIISVRKMFDMCMYNIVYYIFTIEFLVNF